MDLNSKRKNWPILFSDLDLKVTVNEWIKFFFVFWMAYLIYYTDNPISQLLFVSSKEYLANPTLAINLKVIFGGVLYFALILSGVIWACGFKAFREFFPKFRLRSIPLTLLYSILVSIFFFLGLIATIFVPVKLESDISNSMQYASFFDPGAFKAMAVRGFFTTMANVMISVMVFLLVYSILSNLLKKNNRWELFLSYIISGMIYGILLTRPDNPNLLENIVFYAIAMLPAFWAYHRTRSILITTTSIWISSELTAFLILWSSMP